MKECRCCKQTKTDNEFYKRARNLDGLYSYCKECTLKKDYYDKREHVLKIAAVYRDKNKQNISRREAERRLKDPERFEKDKLKHLKWSQKNRYRLNEWQRNWYQNNKEKRRAHVVLSRAIGSGKIMRPNECSECKKQCKPDGHHLDYNKPLEVVWICRACHSRKSPRTVIR
jgi:hypothetical protein